MYKLVYYLLKIFSLLPFKALYFISDILYLIIRYVVKYRLKVVRKNIETSFPQKTKAEKLQIERGFYRHFSDMLVEIPKMLSISEEEILKRIKFENYEAMTRHYDEGKSILMMAAHSGNWEWITSMSLLLPKDKPVYQIYKKLKNDVSDQLFYKIRKVFGSESIEMKELLRKMVAMKKNGNLGIFGMVSDQSPKYTPNLHFVEFLNQPTAVIEGSEQLAKKFNFPVYFISMQKVKRGYYVCNLELITSEPTKTAPYEITEKYMELLEKNIRLQPELWLWSHKRWKHKLIK